MQDAYQLVCYAYYCGWKSDVTDTVEALEKIEKCPRCGAAQGAKLKLESVGN